MSTSDFIMSSSLSEIPGEFIISPQLQEYVRSRRGFTKACITVSLSRLLSSFTDTVADVVIIRRILLGEIEAIFM